jgi:BASS family bile acid:Na+ symporter
MEIVSFSFIDILISTVLAAIMFGLGLSLNTHSFKAIVIKPKAFFVGLGSQMIALPIIAFLLLYFSNLPVAYKMGIMILASCPGGTTSGFVTYLFKGNVALSISLTTINSILTIFTIPLIVNLSLGYFMNQHAELHLPIIASIIQICTVTILPALLGILIRTYKPIIAQILQAKTKNILIVLLALVYAIKFFASQEYGGTGITGSEVWIIVPYAFAFNLLCFLFSIFSGKVAKLSIRDAFTIAIEVSLHNTTLALLVAGSLLKNQDMVKPALIYSMFSFWSAMLFGLITKWIYKNSISN